MILPKQRLTRTKIVKATVTTPAAAPRPFKKQEAVKPLFLTPVEISRIPRLAVPEGLTCVAKCPLGMNRNEFVSALARGGFNTTSTSRSYFVSLSDSTILAATSHALAEFPDARCMTASLPSHMAGPSFVPFPGRTKGVL